MGFGPRTAGDLAGHDPFALSRLEGVPQATKTEIRRQAKELRLLFTPAEAPAAAAEQQARRPPPRGIDNLAATLAPQQTTHNRAQALALRAPLGLQPPGDNADLLRWPTLREASAAPGPAQVKTQVMVLGKYPYPASAGCLPPRPTFNE
jgi:hypothetical protein